MMTKCPYCEAGWPVKRWARYDGTGSWRTHQRGSVTFDSYELNYCVNNSWVSRHRFLTGFIVFYAAMVLVVAFNFAAHARDVDGRYAQSPLKPWFDNLKSKGGAACCSDADGTALSDVDWDTKDGHYRVRLEGEWVVVPDDAVIDEPNRAEKTMVWPFKGPYGWTIRCLLVGAMI